MNVIDTNNQRGETAEALTKPRKIQHQFSEEKWLRQGNYPFHKF